MRRKDNLVINWRLFQLGIPYTAERMLCESSEVVFLS